MVFKDFGSTGRKTERKSRGSVDQIWPAKSILEKVFHRHGFGNDLNPLEYQKRAWGRWN